MRRRDAIVLGGLVAGALALPPYLRNRAVPFEFEPLGDFAGFRRLNSGPVTGGMNIFAGLDAPAEPLQAPERPLCVPLFGSATLADDALPVAVFGDAYCPNCIAFESRLDRLARGGSPIRIVHHQLPLLGDRSVRAARVVLAAGLQQSDNTVYRDLLQRGLRPGPAAIRDVADRHGLNADQLIADTNGAEVADRLGKALGLGAALGIPGTPSFGMGRTLVIGAMSEKDLVRLIELERDDPFTGC